MGVTNHNEVQYKYPDELSSTESLHIPGTNNSTSSITSIESVAPNLNVVRRPRRRINPANSPLGSPRHTGRRRLRRYNAICELEALIEEEEPEFEVIPHKSPFTIILEKLESEPVWNNFIDEDESKSIPIPNQIKPECSKPQVTTAYSNISYRIKKSFKSLRDVGELERQELEILSFFTKNPLDNYINESKSSFQRLLIHGIAQYYGLRSTSYDDENGNRVIKVTKHYEGGIYSKICLSKIIEENHNTS